MALDKTLKAKLRQDLRTDRRLDLMRQITKPNSQVKDKLIVWHLVENETEKTLGIYSTEDKAWEVSEQIWDAYQIEADVLEVEVDADFFGLD